MENEYDFKRYKKAPKTGLKKFGDTSYLNAVLQCLGNIYELANYFLNPKYQILINSNINIMPLSFVLERLFIRLYPYPEKDEPIIYGNDKVLSVLANYNITYKSTKTRNPKDLINLILDIIHSELNTKKSLNKNLNYNNFDFNSIINTEIVNFFNTNDSIISRHFSYSEIKENLCIICKKTIYELHHYYTFDLDILNCASKIEKSNITVTDCLNYLSIPKIKNFFCQNCNQHRETNIISRIYGSPEIFIFLLDRGNFESNLMDIKFTIEDKLDLNNYIENKDSPKEYELIGIVSISKKEKIYIGFSKSPIDNQWYIYNEEKVDLIDINSVINNNNDLNLYIPCILFYNSIKKINNEQNK